MDQAQAGERLASYRSFDLRQNLQQTPIGDAQFQAQPLPDRLGGGSDASPGIAREIDGPAIFHNKRMVNSQLPLKGLDLRSRFARAENERDAGGANPRQSRTGGGKGIGRFLQQRPIKITIDDELPGTPSLPTGRADLG